MGARRRIAKIVQPPTVNALILVLFFFVSSESLSSARASIDSRTMLPLTCAFASANKNEKKHSLNMLEMTKQILKQSAAKLRSMIADSQYSDGKLRNAVYEAVIPYPTNQKQDVRGLLRVDK